MKATARISLVTLCAACGIGLAWWVSAEGDVGRADSITPDQASNSAAGDLSAAAPAPPENHANDAAGERRVPWQANAAQPRHLAGTDAGRLQTAAAHEHAAEQTTSGNYLVNQAFSKADSRNGSGVVQAQGLSEGSQADQANSLLYVQTRHDGAPAGTGEQGPNFSGPGSNAPLPDGSWPRQDSQYGGNSSPHDSTQGDGTQGYASQAAPPASGYYDSTSAGNASGSVPFGPQPASSLVVRLVRATRPMRQDEQGRVIPEEGDDKLEVYVNNRDIREVLTLLSEQSGMNILPLQGVTGSFSFAMNGVTVDQALEGILRSTGFVAKRDGAFVLVGTPQDFEQYNKAYDRIATRIYRPDYISAAELQTLLTKVLSPAPIGNIQATTAPGQGIASNQDEAGGNSNSDTDALLVQDYESVLQRIDRIVLELDRRPLQVAIEAMILSVAVKDGMEMGVDFQFLRNQGTVRFGLGTPTPDLDGVSFDDGGLKFAFLDSNLATFIKALETIGDTDVIATPRLTVLNKQRAEILIGSQLGYVNTTVTETAATQSVDFLEIGTQLRLRPYIARDGSIRLEVHPELSTGNVRIEGGFTLPDKEVTSVTTNIMVQDGCTIVIGGLMREDLVTNNTQVPYLGNLPWLGALFRSKTESTEKREIVLLVTPRIVREPDLCAEGDAAACEFHRRQAAYADKMSPVSRTALGRDHFRLAQEAWARGDRDGALNQIHWSLQFDRQNRAALDLQNDILSNHPTGNHTIPPQYPHGQLPSPVPPYAYPQQQSGYPPPSNQRPEVLPPGMGSPDGPGMGAPTNVPPGNIPRGNVPPSPAPGGTQATGTPENRSALRPNYR